MPTPGGAPTNPPRSALLCLTGLRIGGGIAGVSRCIARALDEEVAAGRMERTDRVLLLEDDADPAPPPTRGDQHLARGSRARFVWQTWRTCLRHRPDLVLFDLVGLARARLSVPGLAPARTAIFVHGMELGAFDEGRSARARDAKLLRRADLVLANSHFSAERLGRLLPEIADRLRVVPLCIDPDRVALWEEIEHAQPAPPRARAALIVGRMWAAERGKGHDELIAAWPAVRRAVPDAELWVAGAGDDAPRLAEEARKGGVGDAVRLLGSVSDAELASLYRRASVFAMPSRQEGFGLVYAEAMWWGLPCIGSTADAAGQVIAAGETGELVPYGDPAALARALVDLLSDRARSERMGEAGRRRARERFHYARFRRDLCAALGL
jgi:phosphatidylinositol alpha-1,6-mannosyltransferase